MVLPKDNDRNNLEVPSPLFFSYITLNTGSVPFIKVFALPVTSKSDPTPVLFLKPFLLMGSQ